MGTLRDKFKKVKIKRLAPPKPKPISLTKVKAAKLEKEIEKNPEKKRRMRRKKVYVKEKCHWHDDEGTRCSRNAVGSGQLCEKHGGKKYEVENTLSPEATLLYAASKGETTKFNPTLHPLQMVDLARQGCSEVEIAAEIGVGVSTLKHWAETYQEMALAFDLAKTLHEAWWLTKGKQGLEQRNFNTSLFKFLTGNTLGWADKKESKNLNTNVCGVLVAPPTQSVEEWESAKVVNPGNEEGVVDI